MMTRLQAALRELEIEATADLGGQWVEIMGERCRVFVVEAPRNDLFFTWCDAPDARSIEAYDDPVDAVQAGLRRAARPMPSGSRIDQYSAWS